MKVSRALLADMRSFADDFTPLAVEHRDEPFTSYWMENGLMLQRAGSLMLQHAAALRLGFDVVAGNGAGGRIFATSMIMVPAEDGNNRLSSAWLNNDHKDTDTIDGYGVHGARVGGERTLLVGDIAGSDGSQISSINMLRKAGAIVTDALWLCLADQSGGRAAEALSAIDVNLRWLFDFDESNGLFRPAAHLLEAT